MRRQRSVAALAVGMLSLATAVAQADSITYPFFCITNNDAADCAVGEAQLSVTVSNDGVGFGQVKFTFNNSGPQDSSIADAYFDDGTLLGIATIINGPGVSFSLGASPPDLPGGNALSPPFEATAGFTADSDPPAQPNGVNTGEFLTIVFDLQEDGAFNDVISELDTAELRIGIHVQGFEGGGSESFLNRVVTRVPEPGVLIAMGAGFAGLGWLRRRRGSARGGQSMAAM